MTHWLLSGDEALIREMYLKEKADHPELSEPQLLFPMIDVLDEDFDADESDLLPPLPNGIGLTEHPE